MAIQDISVYSDNHQTGSDGASVPDVSVPGVVTRLFQDKLESDRLQLAQVTAPVAPPVAPVNITPVQPAPVFLNPSIAPGISAPKPPALTPYTTPEIKIPTYRPRPRSPNPSGVVQGTGHTSVKGKAPDHPPGPVTPLTPIDIPAWNQSLKQVSDTLRLELLSPAAQLTINRAADQSISLNTEYALGLQTRADGHALALVGFLNELVGLFSKPQNVEQFAPMLNPNASVTLKGLQQRHAQAQNSIANQRALNHARAQIKALETAGAAGQRFKEQYPGLSLSTVADRSGALKNGMAVNQQSDQDGQGLHQLYVLGYQLPVQLNSHTIKQVPINLVGPLEALGQFIKSSGDGWLKVGGLTSNTSTGLTLKGLIQRYETAKANASPDIQRNADQAGGRLAQPLAEPSDLSEIYDPENSISTELPGGGPKDSAITVKTSTNDDEGKNNSGVISVRSSTPFQITVTPVENTHGSEPIKASADDMQADDAFKDQDVSAEQQEALYHEIINNIIRPLAFVMPGLADERKDQLKAALLDLLNAYAQLPVMQDIQVKNTWYQTIQEQLAAIQETFAAEISLGAANPKSRDQIMNIAAATEYTAWTKGTGIFARENADNFMHFFQSFARQLPENTVHVLGIGMTGLPLGAIVGQTFERTGLRQHIDGGYGYLLPTARDDKSVPSDFELLFSGNIKNGDPIILVDDSIIAQRTADAVQAYLKEHFPDSSLYLFIADTLHGRPPDITGIEGTYSLQTDVFQYDGPPMPFDDPQAPATEFKYPDNPESVDYAISMISKTGIKLVDVWFYFHPWAKAQDPGATLADVAIELHRLYTPQAENLVQNSGHPRPNFDLTSSPGILHSSWLLPDGSFDTSRVEEISLQLNPDHCPSGNCGRIANKMVGMLTQPIDKLTQPLEPIDPDTTSPGEVSLIHRSSSQEDTETTSTIALIHKILGPGPRVGTINTSHYGGNTGDHTVNVVIDRNNKIYLVDYQRNIITTDPERIEQLFSREIYNTLSDGDRLFSTHVNRYDDPALSPESLGLQNE